MLWMNHDGKKPVWVEADLLFLWSRLFFLRAFFTF
jgi:hypothetical protein